MSRYRKGLLSLLKRPWFERVWIIQEVANAQSAIIQSGALSVPAHVFVLGPALLGLDVDPHVQSILELMPGPLEHVFRSISRQDDLITLLKKFRASKATDVRDKIFALHDLSCEPLNHELLRADYTKTLPEMAQNTIRYWFEMTTVTIHQVIDFLVDLETVDTMCLIPPESTQTTRETIQIPLQSDRNTALECVRDASLFLLGQKVTDGQGALHTELNRLRQKLNENQVRVKTDEDLFQVGLDEETSEFLNISPRARNEDILKVISWPGSGQNLHFLVVGKAREALLLAGLSGCEQICGLIADGSTDNKQELLQTTLRDAIASGYWNMLKLLLNIGLDANTKVEEGTLLQVASHRGHKHSVQRLLEHGADVNAQGGEYGTALQAATLTGQKQTVQLLLEQGADSSVQGRMHGTVLHAASFEGIEDIVRLLLRKGADPNARGVRNLTALQAASLNGHQQTVELLLENGADVNAHGGEHGTALQAASSKGHLQVVQLLLAKGADVNARGGQYRTALEAALLNGHKRIWKTLYELTCLDEQVPWDIELLRSVLVINDVDTAYKILAGHNKAQVVDRLRVLGIKDFEEFQGGLVRFQMPERSQWIYLRLSRFSG